MAFKLRLRTALRMEGTFSVLLGTARGIFMHLRKAG